MRLLLDTHVVLWALTDDPRLAPAVRDVLVNGTLVTHDPHLRRYDVAVLET